MELPSSLRAAAGFAGIFIGTIGAVLLNAFGNPANAINASTAGNCTYLVIVSVALLVGSTVIDIFKKKDA